MPKSSQMGTPKKYYVPPKHRAGEPQVDAALDAELQKTEVFHETSGGA